MLMKPKDMMRKPRKPFLRCLTGAVLLLTILWLLSACDLVLKPVFSESTQGAETTKPTFGSEPLQPSDSGESDSTPKPSDSQTPPLESDEAPTDSSETPSPCLHTPVSIPGTLPTCTEGGRSEGSICGDCGISLSPSQEIPPTGHRYEAELDYRCGLCGVQAVCPAPILSETHEAPLPWGTTLTLTWTLSEETPLPVVYMAALLDESGNAVELWDSWRADTRFDRLCDIDGEVLTLQVYACLAVDDEPVMATQSVSDSATFTVATREALEAPAFLMGNQISVPIQKETTVAWSPASDEGGRVSYVVSLCAPDGSVTDLGQVTETVLTIPAHRLSAEGLYTLRVLAHDESNTYRDSPTAQLTIRVSTPPPPGEQDYADPARYASDYFYRYLATQPNGYNLQRFYRLIDTSLTEFHTSGADAETVSVSGGKTYHYASKLNFALCGLTFDEAVSVRFMYLYDHPLYYWLSNVYVYNSTALYFCVESDYASGEARTDCNAMIYAGVAEMAEGLSEETSAYGIALAFYERLLAQADYAYEQDGVTPQDDHWAHSIVGAFDPTYHEVVCEGFAKVYGLLLNYHGVENIPVIGTSRGVGHMWNLLRLDDGEWYWCDITWDDRTYSPLGTDYKYFCVTDTQDVLYYHIRDGIEAGKQYTFNGSGTFMEDHTVDWEYGIVWDMTDALPDRAETPFESEGLTLRETFTVEGMTYALTGYGTVQLTEVQSRRSITVPETVTYGGVTYTVASVGLIHTDGVYMTGRLLPLFTTSVYIPKTVSYIWDNALSGLLVTVTVDPENPWYTSQGGTIIPKNNTPTARIRVLSGHFYA